MISVRMRSLAVLLTTLTVLPLGGVGAVAHAVPPLTAPGTEAELEPRDAARVSCSKQAGPYQRQVERWLERKVDGKQSAADCRAVRAFQQKEKIEPAIGFAGPVTWARMTLNSATKNPNAAKRCPVRTYRVACVDLDRQVTWVQQGKKVVFGPVSMRSGRAGHRTRAGWHTVYWRHEHHVSTIYHTAMPYAQFFSGGQAFHAVYGSIHTTVGSWGCVNLTLRDARKLWGVLRKNDRVYVWGHRPGP
ncbi:L,D-transpeptidase family protein [Streptomyces sp. NPDC059582]|uniref:L,D-transpeptidase family protein n=1 Tax=Streptomyces sp. NPDC059582 TaxID=3346875 RepID=UPI00369473C5